jgi:hypothetical protein
MGELWILKHFSRFDKLRKFLSWNKDEYKVNGEQPVVTTVTPVRPARRRKARNLVVPISSDSGEIPPIYINEMDQSPQSHSYDNQSFQSHEAHGNGRTNGRFEHTLHV